MAKQKGKFIVIYGINNIGKTTQAKITQKKLKNKNIKSEYIKYPVYNSEPAGKLINQYLRQKNPYNFTPREAQLLHYIDRINFQPKLVEKLNSGINIIAEEYFGTALAWGIASGVEEKLLKYLYSFLYPEDIAILLDGAPFEESKEKNHINEQNQELTRKTIKQYEKIAEEYSWKTIDANQGIEKVSQEIEEIIMPIIKK
jgi:thymidylate kinase